MEEQPHERPSPAILNYALLRNIGAVLDECSAQGLQIWPDNMGRWFWRWIDIDLEAKRGMWAMGEALVDAVATRFPAYFESPTMLDAPAEI